MRVGRCFHCQLHFIFSLSSPLHTFNSKKHMMYFSSQNGKTSWIFSFFFWQVTRLGFIHLQPTCGKVNPPVENIIASIQPVVVSLKVLQLCGKKTHLQKLVGFQNTRMGKNLPAFPASVSSDWRHHLKSVCFCFGVSIPSSFTKNLPKKNKRSIQMSHWKSKPKVWSWRHATVPDVVKRWVNEIQVPGLGVGWMVSPSTCTEFLGTKSLASRKVSGKLFSVRDFFK